MFIEYFKLTKQPFGSTPDPSFLFRGDSHREALASLYCGFYGNRGFTALIAEPGMGKTTLLFEFLDHIQARTVFLFNTLCDPTELLSLILRDLNITPNPSTAVQYQQLNTVLIAEARVGRRVVLVIDEAQNLSIRALEAVRLLTNFETPREKLIQVVLAGQPELADTLSKPEVTQLKQRISTVCRLAPLTASEVSSYIEHRLRLADCKRGLFTAAAIDLIAQTSRGIPRTINTLCFNSLCLCYARNLSHVNEEMVAEAINDILLPGTKPAISEPSRGISTETASCTQILEPREGTTSTMFGASRPQVETSRNWRLWFATAVLLAICATFGMTTRIPTPSFPQAASVNAMKAIGLGQPGVNAGRGNSSPTADLSEPARESHLRSTNPMKVTIRQGDTLEAIVTDHLGAYNGSVLREIRALNPRMTDPNRIESGRTVRLPAQANSTKPSSYARTTQ